MRLNMPIVKTKRLLLRPIQENDTQDLFLFLKDPEVVRYLTFPKHNSVDQTRCFIKTCYLSYIRMGQPQTWSIVWRSTSQVIGTIGFHTMEDDHAQVGYMLHRDFWHKGIMQEALRELIHVGFTYTGLRRLEAYYQKEHRASERLLKTCGFQMEGCLRQYTMLQDGVYHDMHIAAILKDDWKENHK